MNERDERPAFLYDGQADDLDRYITHLLATDPEFAATWHESHQAFDTWLAREVARARRAQWVTFAVAQVAMPALVVWVSLAPRPISNGPVGTALAGAVGLIVAVCVYRLLTSGLRLRRVMAR